MSSSKLIYGSKSQRIALSAGLIAIALAAGLGWSDPFVPNVWADPTPPMQLGGMQEGQITAVGLTFLEIEQKSYRLDPKVEIRHENGKTLEMRQLEPGMGVQFKLKEGALSHVVVLVPR